jgi:prolipoprotein diacylglyceryltransferase
LTTARAGINRYLFNRINKGSMLVFSLWVGIGASLGLWRLARSAQRRPAEWVNAGLFVLVFALCGARLSFAANNLGYFAGHVIEIPMIWLGGLTWPGALLGALLALGIQVVGYRSPRTGKVSPGWLGDQLYPLLPTLAIGAWLGCWQAGCGYGTLAPSGAWWAVPAITEYGLLALRWPVQALAALSLVVFFALLERWVTPMRSAGRLSSLALIGLLLHLFIFTGLVADPSPYWNGLRLDTWAALIMLIAFSTYLLAYQLLVRGKQHVRRRWSRYSRG